MTVHDAPKKKTEILRLTEMHGRHCVRVFGCVATGQNRPDSDVDILVEFDSGKLCSHIIGLELGLEQLPGVSVDQVAPKSFRDARDRVVAEALQL